MVCCPETKTISTNIVLGNYLIHPSKEQEDIITINEPVDYMARAVMILMGGKDIMRAFGSNVFAQHQNHKGQAPYKKQVHW